MLEEFGKASYLWGEQPYRLLSTEAALGLAQCTLQKKALVKKIDD